MNLAVSLALFSLSGHGCQFATAFSGAITQSQSQIGSNKLPHHHHLLPRTLRSPLPTLPRTQQLYATAEVDAPSKNNKYDDLIQWFLSSNEKSYISSKVEIRPSTRGGLATGGYGMFASDDLSEGESILCIPRDCCVTLDDALNDIECGPSFKNLMEKAGPGSDTVVLVGYLAKEYLLLKEYERRLEAGEKPDDNAEMRRLSKIKFASYFRTLPWARGVNAQEHVLFWEDEDVDSLLKGSLAYDDAMETRSSVELAIKVLNGIVGPIVCKARGEEEEAEEEGFTFPWQSKEEEKPSLDDEILDGLEEAVRGAFVISLSRAFAARAEDGKEEDRLEPVLDILQHSNNPNVSHKCSEDGSIEVTARTTIKSGEELFNQYRGEEDVNMPYHKFFTRFGFVPGVTEPVANLISERSTIFFPQRAEV
eukprot:CAMPEP_0183725914 /NCGR_PEP_ID=MMETSP0737-20130205/21895_1 /TAXON_ID=385413 /ORGANISM="Thalassiosira miniscula, Strain CCMP1093" /LENGTH=421 /DNA_ID=CAMNT_0025957081 /DNA_START=22 /DNA_END=1287 /DNA_ORIENTATION=-